MPPSSVAARSLALAVIGVGGASFAAQGQTVTAFNPYSGAGLTGGPPPRYPSPPAASTVDAVGTGPVGPAFNPWSSNNPAQAARQAALPQTSAPAVRTKAVASLQPPLPGPIESRVVAVPELTTSRSTPAVPARAAAPAVAAAPPPQTSAAPQHQTAAIAPVPGPPVRNVVAITAIFSARSTELLDGSKAELDRFARDITERTLRHVELRTIADNGDPDSRKISLARALIVRNYLIDKGVRSRIEIASIVGEGGERVEILVPSTMIPQASAGIGRQHE